MYRFRYVLIIAIVAVLIVGLFSLLNQSLAPKVEARSQAPARIEGPMEPDTPPIVSQTGLYGDVGRMAESATDGKLFAWRLPAARLLHGDLRRSPDQKSKGWVVGDSGVILTYCNGVWDHAIIVESIPTSLYGVQAISPTLGVAVGQQGAVLMYLWDSDCQDWVWTKSPLPVGNQSLNKVSMVPSGAGYIGWAVGQKDAAGHGTLVYGTITPITINGHPTYTYAWSNVTADHPSLPQVDYYYGLKCCLPITPGL